MLVRRSSPLQMFAHMGGCRYDIKCAALALAAALESSASAAASVYAADSVSAAALVSAADLANHYVKIIW